MANLEHQIEIKRGIPEPLRHQAASICYDGFLPQNPQIGWLFGSRQKGIMLLAQGLNLEQALTAQVEGQLVGFVGLKYENRPFFQFERSNFIRELGLLRGLLAFLCFNNTSTVKPLSNEMSIAVLVVDLAMRSQGIGGLLMKAAFEIAQQNQCSAVVLDTAITNAVARRLYERLGFTTVRTIEFKYLPKWLSTGATIMRKDMISS
jgi:ribosomal protein S18 acetylase RimI-like enzyme